MLDGPTSRIRLTLLTRVDGHRSCSLKKKDKKKDKKGKTKKKK